MCWGSFLNVVAYRLIKGDFFSPRSFCPKCKKIIVWYDNIPIISWIILKAKCRNCKTKISALYPFIEIFTAITMTALYLIVPTKYFFAYFIFFSALIVTIRTDIEFMLISRLTTIFLIPLAFIFSYFQLLPISVTKSLLGIILGYGFLFIISQLFYLLRKKKGMGEGDLELLALIGAFLGPAGCWISLFLGSILGSVYGLIYMIKTKNRSAIIPFGHFLAFGAISYVLFGQYLQKLILGF